MDDVARSFGIIDALMIGTGLVAVAGSALADTGRNSAPDDAPAVFTAGEIVPGSQLAETPLGTLTPPSSGDMTRTPIGGGWRHAFDIVLTRDGSDHVVFDSDGTRRRFRSDEQAADVFVGVRAVDGRLDRADALTRWRRPNGSVVIFEGSVPVRIEHSGSAPTHLHYDAGRLIRINRPDGRTQHLHYREGRLFRISESRHGDLRIHRVADGSLHLERRTASEVSALGIESDECRAETGPTDGAGTRTEPERMCDAGTNPPPRSFATASSVAGSIRVDARPASCRSYFIDYAGTERGTVIERGLHGLSHYADYRRTVRSFPIVDFIGPELRVVRSRDLGLPSYNRSGDGLYERLLRDGDDIRRQLIEPLERDGTISVTELGESTTLTHDPTQPVVLELLVRHGLASATQQDQIRRARFTLRERHDIDLRVIEIP